MDRTGLYWFYKGLLSFLRKRKSYIATRETDDKRSFKVMILNLFNFGRNIGFTNYEFNESITSKN